jgi:hypothetical protein
VCKTVWFPQSHSCKRRTLHIRAGHRKKTTRKQHIAHLQANIQPQRQHELIGKQERTLVNTNWRLGNIKQKGQDNTKQKWHDNIKQKGQHKAKGTRKHNAKGTRQHKSNGTRQHKVKGTRRHKAKGTRQHTEKGIRQHKQKNTKQSKSRIYIYILLTHNSILIPIRIF